MAKLKDTTIEGNLNVSKALVLDEVENGVKLVHPTSGEAQRTLNMSQYGNVVVNYDGYINANANTNIYGNDIKYSVASAGNADCRPYYRAGDSITMTLYTTGFVTSSGKSIRFLIPLSKPIIGNPTITITSGAGITLRQNNQYTHGSTASTSVKPSTYATIGYTDSNNTNSNGFAVVATMSEATNVTNNDTLGIYWDGTITFS